MSKKKKSTRQSRSGDRKPVSAVTLRIWAAKARTWSNQMAATATVMEKREMPEFQAKFVPRGTDAISGMDRFVNALTALFNEEVLSGGQTPEGSTDE